MMALLNLIGLPLARKKIFLDKVLTWKIVCGLVKKADDIKDNLSSK